MNSNLSKNTKTKYPPKEEKRLKRTLCKLACISVLIVVLSYVTLKLWVSSCDLSREHEEMTCPLKNALYAIPHILTTSAYTANFLSQLGLVDFKTSFRLMMNRIDINRTGNPTYPVAVRYTVIDGIATYSYTPNAIANSITPVVFYFHGGGGIMLSPKISDHTLRYLANEMKVRIIAPNYRKSPEVLFPQPQEDCINVVKHILERADQFSIDVSRVFIMGDSFGGHVAVYVAFKWNELGLDRQYAPIRGLIPVYPRLQWVNLQLDSYLPDTNNGRASSPRLIALYVSLALIGSVELVPYILNNSLARLSQFYQERREAFPNLLMETDWDPPTQLVSRYSKHADKLLSPYATLLFQSNFSVLPPTLLVAAEYDTLRSEGLLFKSRLETSGVSVEYYEADKMFHGFFHYSGATQLSPCIEAYAKVARFVGTLI